jgi:four helix bundle protein
MKGFQELVVWQRAMELCEEIYRVAAKLPEQERFGLVQQVRRAAVSVPSNIAEGHSRQSTGDYRHHLQMARGSAAEIQTQLILAQRMAMIPPGTATKAMNLADECMKMLATLISKLR